MEYRVGQKIEVLGKDEGFEGSYYAATVISKESPNQYKVEYCTLLKEDESGPLQELLPVDRIRPYPPDLPNDAFSLEEVVDAYFNDGWWIGLIEGKFGSEYFVQFPHNDGGEEVPFTIDKLRVHLEWSSNNGKWRPCSTYKKRMKNTLYYRSGRGPPPTSSAGAAGSSSSSSSRHSARDT